MNKQKVVSRNYALIFIAVIIIVFDILLLAFTVLYIKQVGWWAILTVLGALSSISMACIAIKKNDPAWLLLDVLFPV